MAWLQDNILLTIKWQTYSLPEYVIWHQKPGHKLRCTGTAAQDWKLRGDFIAVESKSDLVSIRADGDDLCGSEW